MVLTCFVAVGPGLVLSLHTASSYIGQVWVGDITECHYRYLAVLMDAYSRRIVG